MSLGTASLLAERERGCRWASRFCCASEVVKDGGTIVGAPIFSSDGVTLSGVTDYLWYNIPANLLNKSRFGLVIEFTPHFAASEAVDRYLFDTTNTERYFVLRNSLGSLQVNCGGSTVVGLALSIWSPYWRQNQRNTLVVSASTGDSSLWLNGYMIQNSSAVAWTPKAPTRIAVGSFSTGGFVFDGVIHGLKLFSTGLPQLTDQEGYDYCARTQVNALRDSDAEAVGTASWGASASTLSKESGRRTGGSGLQVLRITKTGAGDGYATQASILGTIPYRWRGWARGDGTAYPSIIFNGSGYLWTGTTSTEWQYFDVPCCQNGAVLADMITRGGGAGNYTEWDDLELVIDTDGPFGYMSRARHVYTGRVDTYDPVVGRVLDASGNARHGTISGCTKVTGFPGINFDGDNDSIQCDAMSGADNQAFSASCWLRRDANAGNDDRIFCFYQNDNTTIGVMLYLVNNEIRMASNSGAGATASGFYIPLSDRSWHHLVSVVGPDKTWRLYVDGLLVYYTGAVMVIPSYGTRFRWGYTATSFAGVMRQMEVWEYTALTPLQVYDLYMKERREANWL